MLFQIEESEKTCLNRRLEQSFEKSKGVRHKDILGAEEVYLYNNLYHNLSELKQFSVHQLIKE